MLTENRNYHFNGELILNKSHILNELSEPKNDKVNWLFLNTGEQQFGFIYKIENPSEAKYGRSFKVKLAFTMIESVRNIVTLNYIYEVLRGQEVIGTLCLISTL